MKIRPGTDWATAPRTSPSCDTWRSTSCKRTQPRDLCAGSSSAPAGTTPTSPVCSPYSEVRLPWRADPCSLVRSKHLFLRSLIASHFASSFLPARGFSVRLKRRFPAPAIHLPDIARSVGQDLARQRQPRSGLVLTEASTVSRSSGWRLLSLPDHGSFRGLTRQPQHGIGEGGTSMSRTRSSVGAATKEARLPGLVPAGTCSRLGQADLLSLTIEPDLFILPPPKRRPSRSRNRPARRDA